MGAKVHGRTHSAAGPGRHTFPRQAPPAAHPGGEGNGLRPVEGRGGQPHIVQSPRAPVPYPLPVVGPPPADGTFLQRRARRLRVPQPHRAPDGRPRQHFALRAREKEEQVQGEGIKVQSSQEDRHLFALQLPARDHGGRLRQDAVFLPAGVLQGEEPAPLASAHGGGAARGGDECQSVEGGECSHTRPKFPSNVYESI